MMSSKSDSDDNTTPLLNESGGAANLEVADYSNNKKSNIKTSYVLVHSIVICIGMY